MVACACCLAVSAPPTSDLGVTHGKAMSRNQWEHKAKALC